jgi:predicted anti-sigma-YlaC factor YlaD
MNFAGDIRMNCEEFATAGLDLGSAGTDGMLQKAAREHLRECAHCAALHENWLSLREDLRVLGAEMAELEAPARVEMRLRQEFRSKHKTVKTQRAALVLGWSLTAAVALFLAVTWANWYMHRGPSFANKTQPAQVHTATAKGSEGTSAEVSTPTGSELNDVIVASNGYGDFTLLPGSVQMQRAALGALGLTVNEEHAGDWIQVDLLVGDDGLPQAVRLPQTSTESSN